MLASYSCAELRMGITQKTLRLPYHGTTGPCPLPGYGSKSRGRNFPKHLVGTREHLWERVTIFTTFNRLLLHKKTYSNR